MSCARRARPSRCGVIDRVCDLAHDDAEQLCDLPNRTTRRPPPRSRDHRGRPAAGRLHRADGCALTDTSCISSSGHPARTAGRWFRLGQPRRAAARAHDHGALVAPLPDRSRRDGTLRAAQPTRSNSTPAASFASCTSPAEVSASIADACRTAPDPPRAALRDVSGCAACCRGDIARSAGKCSSPRRLERSRSIAARDYLDRTAWSTPCPITGRPSIGQMPHHGRRIERGDLQRRGWRRRFLHLDSG